MISYYEKKMAEINSDPYQKEALKSVDNTVVLAGPGSGKTSVLTLKVVNLLDGYIQEPHGLACITYSRETVREFKNRLEKLGFNSRRNVFLGTVHSFCLAEIIGPFSKIYDLGIPVDYRIASSKETDSIFAKTKSELGIVDNNVTITDMNRERSLRITGESQIEYELEEKLRVIANLYEKKMFDCGLIDFDSIIIKSVQAIQNNEYIRKCLSSKFSWLLIDEYQDLGHPLHEMVISLFKKTKIKIFAVGDPDQSIYSFAGSKPEYLRELSEEQQFKTIRLMNNYRSNQEIIDGSEIVLNEIRNYVAKTRNGEHARYDFFELTNGIEDQYRFVSSNLIKKYREEGIPYDEIAILVGNNHQCRDISLLLHDAGIPFYISKHDFDITDFVKWIGECAKFVSGDRKVFNEIFQFWSSLDFVKEFLISDDDIIIEKKRIMGILIDSSTKSDCIYNWLVSIIKEFRLDIYLKSNKKYPDELENLRKLYKELKTSTYKSYTVSMFEKIGKPVNQVTITTRHSSKGLEFEAVILLGMEEGHFPAWYNYGKPKKQAEEDRLCFVCVSRAKKICALLYSIHYLGNYNRIKVFGPSKYYVSLKKYFNNVKQ